MSRLLRELHEGGQEDDGERGSADAHEDPPKANAPKATYAVYSQLQDWLCRGTHPLLRHMSLYVYSMWVYRVERNQFSKDKNNMDDTGSSSRPHHMDIPFDATYPGANAWMQRIATEPRVPRPDGM